MDRERLGFEILSSAMWFRSGGVVLVVAPVVGAGRFGSGHPRVSSSKVDLQVFSTQALGCW